MESTRAKENTTCPCVRSEAERRQRASQEETGVGDQQTDKEVAEVAIHKLKRARGVERAANNNRCLIRKERPLLLTRFRGKGAQTCKAK